MSDQPERVSISKALDIATVLTQHARTIDAALAFIKLRHSEDLVNDDLCAIETLEDADVFREDAGLALEALRAVLN